LTDDWDGSSGPSVDSAEEADEDYGPTQEERLTRLRRLLWALAIAVLVGASLWVMSRIAMLLFERPGVRPTQGVAEVLQWTRIIDPAAYGVMIAALVIMGALLLLDILQRRLTGRPAFSQLPGPIETADQSDSMTLEVEPTEGGARDEADDSHGDGEDEEELTEADLTDEEFARLLLAERRAGRGHRSAVLIGARIALVILALAALTWAATQTAASYYFPVREEALLFEGGTPQAVDFDFDTYLLLQQIALSAQSVGLGMLALLGGGVLVHELGRRLSVTD
jgi:hypothetical protein